MGRDTIERLYIPQGIKHTNEKFNGIPDNQILKILFILGVFLIVDLLIYIITKNVPISAGSFLIQSFGTGLYFKRDENTNISISDTMRFMLRFNKSQKYYPYIALKEWRY